MCILLVPFDRLDVRLPYLVHFLKIQRRISICKTDLIKTNPTSLNEKLMCLPENNADDSKVDYIVNVSVIYSDKNCCCLYRIDMFRTLRVWSVLPLCNSYACSVYNQRDATRQRAAEKMQDLIHLLNFTCLKMEPKPRAGSATHCPVR